jgi:hypothetical protein
MIDDSSGIGAIESSTIDLEINDASRLRPGDRPAH